MTGGRVARLRDVLAGERFMLTYGDGLADVDVDSLVAHHETPRARATVTAVRPAPRFGSLEVTDGMVQAFEEKPLEGQGRINGGFFVMEPEVLDLLDGDECTLEREPLATLGCGGSARGV